MLTVLIATRNRAGTLSVVLESYCKLQEPSGGWKVVIVDNGSTDNTREVIDAYRVRLPLYYLRELAPGKNASLNTGIASISGDLVVLSDDDAIPREDWLVQLRSVADARPDYAIFGGRVVLRWERPPEPWILDWVPLGPTFTRTEPGAVDGPTEPHHIFGPNMAVRAELFERGYRFNTGIGPRGTSYAMGSETEFVRRLYADGAKLWFCGDALVEHIVPRGHMTRSWILRRAIRFGRGQIRCRAESVRKLPRRWFGVPRYLVRELLVQTAHIVAALGRFDRAGAFRARWEANYAWGQIIEARAVSREAEPRS